MKVIVGDITTQNVDAIVNAANGAIGVMGAGVAKAIRDRGGSSIEWEAKELCSKRLYEPGDVYVTGAGKLQAKYVIHAVTMFYPGGTTSIESVKKCLYGIFYVAQKLQCKSIAIPGLGTSIGRAPLDRVASLYRELIPILEKERGVDAIVCDINEGFISLI